MQASDGQTKAFAGSFALSEDNAIRFSFLLDREEDEEDGPTTLLLLSPEGSDQSCRFHVRRFEPPHAYNRSRSGTLFSNRRETCELQGYEKHRAIINSIVLLDMNFTINDRFEIHGDISLSGRSERYSAVLRIP